MKLNITRAPFSAPLTFLAVCALKKPATDVNAFEEFLCLRTARLGWYSGGGVLGELNILADGKPVPYTYEATPWEMVIKAADGEIRMSFEEEGHLRILGRGLTLRVDMPKQIFDEFLSYGQQQWQIATLKFECKLLFSLLSGKADLEDEGIAAKDLPKAIIFSGDTWEATIEEFSPVYQPRKRTESYQACVESAYNRFWAYANAAAEGVPERFLEAAHQAAYVNYSAQVSTGLIKGRVMLMSKNWMNSIWSWDCQFNAVETASYDPEASWDNFSSPFRTQHETGRLVDAITDHIFSDTYTKPPVQGWALSHLRKAGILSKDQKRWAYDHLLKMVHFWYDYMDWDHDGICQYNHGNDSGWDNCTYFLCGAPIEGPDLSAYLVLCWDELAAVADELGMHTAAAEHRARADEQLNKLIAHSWDGDHFHTYQSGTHNEMDDCDSLLPYLPIILGDRLPKEIFNKLAADLQEENRFLTPYGLATEHVNDAFYVSNGYWRGPIWAPPMMFIIYGLAKGGQTEFAADLAERFCRNCAKEGFCENFDATTGAGLCDRAYTWTSSTFLILAKHYVKP